MRSRKTGSKTKKKGEKRDMGAKKGSQNGTKNLTSNFAKMTPERKKEVARMGAYASHEARKQKTSFKKMIQMISDIPAAGIAIKGKNLEQLQALGIATDEITLGMLVQYMQFLKAIKNMDTRAAEYLRDTIGEKPSVNQGVQAEYEDLTGLADLLKVEEDSK